MEKNSDMRLNYQDPLVVEDAARLMKSDFISLYTKLGYPKDHVGVAWHELRVTDKARNIRTKYGDQATRFYNIEEEVKIRKNDMKSSQLTNKPVKKVVEPVIEDEEDFEQDGEDIKVLPSRLLENEDNVGAVKSSGRKKDGSKEETAKALIASGVIKAKELAEKGGFSLPYAYNMLKKYGK